MIEVKYNINFKKALKELESNKLFETVNEGLSHKVAETSSRFILEGKVKPKLSDKNPRKKKDANDIEKSLEELFTNYQDSIDNVDFRLDTARVKADIQGRTRSFMKRRK